MQKTIIQLIQEVKTEITKIMVLTTFLDSVIVFFVLYFLLTVVHLFPITAIIPAAIFFVVRIVQKVKKIELRRVEDKNPTIKTMLRTAADNVMLDNYVVRELNRDLMKKMKKVASSSFIKFNKIALRMVIIVIFAFSVLFFAANDIHIARLDNFVIDRFSTPTRRMGLEIEGEGYIYEDDDVTKLTGDMVDLELMPLSYQVDLSQVSDPTEKNFKTTFPKEIEAVRQEAFDDKIPKEQVEIVKNYFQHINKI